MKKRIFVLLMVLMLLLGCALPAAAQDVPYESYTYDGNYNEQPAPSMYAADLRMDYTTDQAESALTDVFLYNERLYALDSARSVVLELDKDLQLLRELSFTDEEGAQLVFSMAQGLFVCEAGIYISDTARYCVERFGWDGVRSFSYGKPESPAYDDAIPFAVTRVIVDSGLNVYALVQGLYSGAVMLSENGDFLGFYGPNEVEMTAQMLIDQSWKKLLTEEQKSAMDRFVPIAYTSFDIDSENFVYTCSRNAISESTRVRKLNPSGKGLWDGEKLLFGDYIPQSQWVSGLANVSQIVDVDIGQNGILSILDAARGRIFQYDSNGSLLGVFGGSGTQLGTFERAAAIESTSEYVYVLDGKNSAITRFSVTDYGKLVNEAIVLYNSGEYAKAKPAWTQVLARNSYCQLAYTGIGKALAQEGAYGEALTYLKLGEDREAYADAFEEYRFRFMRENFTALLLGAVGVLLLLWGIGWLMKKHRKPSARVSHWAILKAPINTLDELIYKKQLSVRFSTGVVVFWFLLEIVKYFGTGFAFNENDPADFNIFLPAMSTVILFVLFSMVNWAVCRLTDGLGTFKQIYCSTAYVLLPYLLSQTLVLVLSQIFVLDEAAFLTLISLAGYVWSGILLLVVITRVHEFTISKAVANIALTVFGILIVVFLLFLMVVLFEHVANLVITVYNELTLRA